MGKERRVEKEKRDRNKGILSKSRSKPLSIEGQCENIVRMALWSMNTFQVPDIGSSRTLKVLRSSAITVEKSPSPLHLAWCHGLRAHFNFSPYRGGSRGTGTGWQARAGIGHPLYHLEHMGLLNSGKNDGGLPPCPLLRVLS